MAALLAACSSVQTATAAADQSGNGSASGRSSLMTAQAGQEVDIKLGTIGPGEFDSLPTISSGAVRFVDAAVVGPYEPGGPQQLFRFVAIKPGVAVLSFRHIDDDAATPRTATDTVVVQ